MALKNTLAKTEPTRKIIRVLAADPPQVVTKTKSQPATIDETLGQLVKILRQLEATHEAEIQRNASRAE